jgi:hypothetical protein
LQDVARLDDEDQEHEQERVPALRNRRSRARAAPAPARCTTRRTRKSRGSSWTRVRCRSSRVAPKAAGCGASSGRARRLIQDGNKKPAAKRFASARRRKPVLERQALPNSQAPSIAASRGRAEPVGVQYLAQRDNDAKRGTGSATADLAGDERRSRTDDGRFPTTALTRGVEDCRWRRCAGAFATGDL